jgi:uncharacterized membrane protein
VARGSERGRGISGTAQALARAHARFITGALAVLPVTGVVLASVGEFPIFSSWLLLSFLLYLLVTTSWLAIAWIQLHLRDEAFAAQREGRALSPRYHRLFRTWLALGWATLVALAALFALMIGKPQL